MEGDLVTFTEEMENLIQNFIFWAVSQNLRIERS